MNNTIKIIIAGGIGTIVQKASGLNSFTLSGFLIFMVVFVVLRFLLDTIFPPKKFSELEIELLETKKRVRNKKIFKFLTIIFFIVGGYLVLNSAINYLFFKTNIVYNKGFKPNYDTLKATIVSFNNKIITFHSELAGYFTIIKKDDRYYLFETQKYPKKDKQYLTIYDNKYMIYNSSNIFQHIKKLQNGYEVLKNLQWTAYKEVSKFDMIIKPLWLINPPLIKLSDWDKELIQSNLKTLKLKPFYDLQKRLRKEQQSITKSDLSKLSTMELAKILDKLYKLSGFEYNTNYAIKVYKEFRSRDDKEKRQAQKKYPIWDTAYNLNKNMKIYINNRKLNKILKKYDLGIGYRFNYPILTQFDDMGFPPYSYIMIYDFKTDKKTPVLTNEFAIKKAYNMFEGVEPKLDIELQGDKIIINRSFDKPYILNLDNNDAKKAYGFLVEMIEDMMFQEEFFYSKNNDANFNYTRAKYLVIYDNDMQKLIYEYKDKEWIQTQKQLLDKKYAKYDYLKKYFRSFKINISNNLKSKKPIKYMFFNYKLNKLYNSDELKNFNIKDLLKLSVKDRDVVFVYELKDKQSYMKYSILPRYTNIKIQNMAMSLISTKKIDDKYYIYLIKQQLYRGNIPNQLYYMYKQDQK